MNSLTFSRLACVIWFSPLQLLFAKSDDEGRKFNYEGILHDWWTPEDATEYEQRVAVMVQQANDFHVHGKPVQGKLTSGENIADLGGLRLALRAFKETEQYKKNELIDGFTPLQRFFLAWYVVWNRKYYLFSEQLNSDRRSYLTCNPIIFTFVSYHVMTFVTGPNAGVKILHRNVPCNS